MMREETDDFKRRQIYERVKAGFENQSFLKTIRAKLERAEPGDVVISCERKEGLTQQNGFLHGGVIAAVAEAACGSTALSVAEEGKQILSAEFKMNLLRPITCDEIVAVGSVLKSGRRLIITEAVVKDAKTGKLLAKMSATMIPV